MCLCCFWFAEVVVLLELTLWLFCLAVCFEWLWFVVMFPMNFVCLGIMIGFGWFGVDLGWFGLWWLLTDCLGVYIWVVLYGCLLSGFG